MKKIFSVVIVLVLCLSLCGCAFMRDIADSSMNIKEKAKTFQFDGLSIELTTDFLQMDFISEDYDFIVGNEDLTVMGIKMPNGETDIGDYTVDEFAEHFRNMMIDSNPTEIIKIDGIPSMQYTSNDGDDTQTVGVMYYKGSDCFWILCFATESDDFVENYNDICKYAKSVKCE